jgi:hypothetical protein
VIAFLNINIGGAGMFVLIPIVVVLGVIGVIVAYKREKARREAMLKLASELGLSFNPDSDRDHDDRFRQFSIFSRGRSRKAYNTLSGTCQLMGHEVELIMGDYKYTVDSGSGKNRRSTTHRVSYLLIGVPIDRVPSLVIRPEKFFDKLAAMVGFDDIDFESVEFSRKFLVSSDNKRFAYDLIDPRMMEFLMKDKALALDMEAGHLCVLDGRRRWDVPTFSQRLQWVLAFFDQWPEHVVKSLEQAEYDQQDD